EHVHGRHHAPFRPLEPGEAGAELREGHGQAGQHGLAELGREARLRHLVAPGALGQDRRGRRAVPARLELGRQGTDARVRGRFPEGEAGARAPHEARLEEAEAGPRGRKPVTLVPIRHGIALAELLLAPVAARPQDAAPPPPGTYTLQHIAAAPDGTVLDVQGAPKRFSRFTTGKVTLLSLIYTRCGDGTGCPLASHLMRQLKETLDGERDVSGKVRFV